MQFHKSSAPVVDRDDFEDENWFSFEHKLD